MRRRTARFGASIGACACVAALVPAVATASALIGRDGSAVRLQVDAAGHALVSFRS